MKLLLIFINEADRYHDRPLYQVLVERLHQLDAAGATAQTGMMGFGHHIHLHHKAFFGIADDRPVTSTVVDDKARLRAAVADIRPIVRAGVMVLIGVELIADAQRAS